MEGIAEHYIDFARWRHPQPDATNVAGLRTWNSLGCFVKRGEKGILILAPMIDRKKADKAAEAPDDAKQHQAQLYGFQAVYVFDINQTEGKDFPTLTEVQGDVSGDRENETLDSAEHLVEERTGLDGFTALPLPTQCRK